MAHSLIFGNIMVHQIETSLKPFTSRLCQSGVLNKDPTVWLDGARPSPLVLFVLPLPENVFDDVII